MTELIRLPRTGGHSGLCLAHPRQEDRPRAECSTVVSATGGIYVTVAVLLDYGVTEPADLVAALSEQYGIPEMKFEDMGMVKIWSHADPDAGYKLSIDDYMNVTLQVP